MLLCYFIPYFYIAAYITAFGCVLKIVSSDDNPDYKVPWILIVLLIPIAGFMLYFLFYSRKLKKKYIKRLNDINKYKYDYIDSDILNNLKDIDARAYMQANMLLNIDSNHLFKNTNTLYFSSGEKYFESLLEDLKNAKSFIFMEYFIIEEGLFWDSILEILKQKALSGLNVRVVYDDIGCMSTLPGDYHKILKKYNIKATPFSRFRGSVDSEFNNRSHRKITVIDGYIGYTGGINIADEYINKINRFGHWKDTGIRLIGDGVYELTRLFLIDYCINVKNYDFSNLDLYPINNFNSKGYVIPFGDGPKPLYNKRVGKSVITNMLNLSSRYCYITTPYLIIDNELLSVIEASSLRGVDVRIIVPHIPDKKMVFEMTRSFYKRLLDSGVRIYEYKPGFIHAKSYVSDDMYAMIGTINLDYRSLVHHFENGVWIYNDDSILDIKNDIENVMLESIEITKDKLKIGFLKRFFRAIVRIFAPML